MVKRYCPSCKKNTTDFFDVPENLTLCSECRKPYPALEERVVPFAVGEIVRRKVEHHGIFGWYHGSQPCTIAWMSADHSLIKFKEPELDLNGIGFWEAHRFERA